MLVCTAMFCLSELLTRAGIFSLSPFGAVPTLELWFGLWPINSDLFWPWQMVTYALLHGGVLHLFFNMLGLWMFGSELERVWGDRRYLQFMLAGTLAAALTQLALTWITRSPVPTVGISGALYALLLGYGMLFPNRIIMPLFPPIPMKARTFVIVFGALELFLGYTDRSGIAHFAHLGGMLGGFLMIRFWRRQPPFGSRRR